METFNKIKEFYQFLILKFPYKPYLKEEKTQQNV